MFGIFGILNRFIMIISALSKLDLKTIIKHRQILREQRRSNGSRNPPETTRRVASIKL